MSEQSTPADRPVEPVEPVEPTPAEATTAPQPAVAEAPPAPSAPAVATAPVATPVVTRTRRGWLPYLGVGLAGVLLGIVLTCAAGLLIRVAWGHHHGFDGGPGRHAPMEQQRPGPGFGNGNGGGPFRR